MHTHSDMHCSAEGVLVVKCHDSPSDKATKEVAWANHLLTHMLPPKKWIWSMKMVGAVIKIVD